MWSLSLLSLKVSLILRMQKVIIKPDESRLMVKLLDSLLDEHESLALSRWARTSDQQTFFDISHQV